MFRKAERKKAKARIGIAGPAGSGKTYSALMIAKGLANGGKIAMIDTENGSGDLYADLFEYDICNITAPFLPEKYIAAIKEAEKAGYNVIIIDSLSHAWTGEGGLLDLHGRIADSGRGNSYTAWREVTPKHNQLVEAMLQSSSHIIATMRSKIEYIIQQNGNKTEIKKAGLAPIQRDGMEYEFTIFFDLSQDHTANATKDRTTIFDGKYFTPSEETGVTIREWLESGKEDTTLLVAKQIEKELQEAKTVESLEKVYKKHKATIDKLPEHLSKELKLLTTKIKVELTQNKMMKETPEKVTKNS